MARRWFRVFLKIICIVTFIFGVSVIAVSSITVVGVFKGRKATIQTLLGESGSDVKLEAQEHWEDSKQENSERRDKFLPKFDNMKREYKNAILACLVAAIAAGILQALSSLIVIFSCSKDMRHKMKYWLIVNFIVLLTLLICFAISLVYDKEKGHHLDFHQVQKNFQTRISSLKDKTLMENAVDGLNAYFVAVGLNEGILLFSLLVLWTSYCMQCGDSNYVSML